MDMDRDMDRDMDGWVVCNSWLASTSGFRGLAAHIRASRQPKSKKLRKDMDGGGTSKSLIFEAAERYGGGVSHPPILSLSLSAASKINDFDVTPSTFCSAALENQ